MKKSMLVLAAISISSGILLTGCMTPAQKVTKSEQKVSEARKDLDTANEEYRADVESYRKKTAEMIDANTRSIAEFNDKIKNEKEEAKADYQKRLAVLEQKNVDMKRRMDDYKGDGKDKWNSFKEEFSHDMDELGKALKDLVVKNTN